MNLGVSLLKAPTLATDVAVGEHYTVKLGSLTLNLDTVWATAAAAVIVIILGMVLRRKATSGVPGKFQLAWEMGIQAIQKQVDDSIGPRGAYIVPLALSLFVFILTCNVFGVVGIGATYEFLPAPTGDINLPLAMAVYVIVLVHIAAIRNRGFLGYVKHYFARPFSPVLFPVNLFMNVVDEIVKPVTLTLRLFGNLLAGGLMLSLLAALCAWKLGSIPIGSVLSVPLTVVWKLFDLGIGAIQAFIFSLLAILYFDVAMAQDEAH